jgi:hypothetical protein
MGSSLLLNRKKYPLHKKKPYKKSMKEFKRYPKRQASEEISFQKEKKTENTGRQRGPMLHQDHKEML